MNKKVGNEQHSENITLLKRKMKCLKEAVLQEREQTHQLELKLQEAYEQLRKKETEAKKRDDKNETLLIEIRTLQDALIAEKNQRQVKRKIYSKHRRNQKAQIRRKRVVYR